MKHCESVKTLPCGSENLPFEMKSPQVATTVEGFKKTEYNYGRVGGLLCFCGAARQLRRVIARLKWTPIKILCRVLTYSRLLQFVTKPPMFRIRLHLP